VKLNKGYHGQIAANISQQDSLLNYKSSKVTEITDNTLTNNSADKFTVTLADGTQATLDVASTLTYPSAFDKGRKVTMTGQVYFKVKHDANKPFTLIAGTDHIEDIGTEFNVNAYEHTKTTLISGAVKVSENEKSVILKPGEQAIDMIVKVANTEEALAWLQGQIIFHHETLESILKIVARVYDVTFVWEDPETKKLTFGGSVSRTDKLANVLNYFRKAGKVDFKVEGKIVKVFKRNK
jgi:ferric-dicitrate binding protein FerR (iron transport regulator)